MTPNISRRKFLKIAGVTGGIMVIPALLGYELLNEAAGELPVSVPAYASPEITTLSGNEDQQAPLLILINESNDNNPFGILLAEILRTEGLNLFSVANLSAVSSSILAQFDTILLTEGMLDAKQTQIIEGYVARGGQLIAMHSDPLLASMSGVEHLGKSIAEGYLQINPQNPMCHGIARQPLQFHGRADCYRLQSAEAIAWLFDAAENKTEFPAITLNSYGKGQVVLWAFDLTRSVAYTRQGNPMMANVPCAEWDGNRAVNMFVDGWIDLDKLAIPQADEQQRLLVNILTGLSQEKCPLPRLWYFPNKAPGMLIATGDAHKTSETGMEKTYSLVEKYGGHMSIYYTPHIVETDWERAARRAKYLATDFVPSIKAYIPETFAAPTPSKVANWRERGHEFSFHPYVETGLEQGWQRYWVEFTGRGYGPVTSTVRTHRILWTGWVETARVQAGHGIRLNLDYYHWGSLFKNQQGDWLFGYLTGSGLPMRFIDEQGRILNIFQQLTELADDHMVDMGWEWNGPAKLSPEKCVEISKTLFQNSVKTAPTAFVAQFHADPFGFGSDDVIARAQHFMEGTLTAATSAGFPIWSAQEWLHFTEVRHNTDFRVVQWHQESQLLSFQLVAQEAPDIELPVMIPLQHNRTRLAQVEVDGQTRKYNQQTVGGVDYGWLSVSAGPHQIVARYS